MSETKSCGCGKAQSACSAPASGGGEKTKPATKSQSTAKTESTAKSTSTSASSASSQIQNGKGDAPRNISPQFRKNFDGIRWDSSRRAKRQEGVRFVKTY